MSDQENIIQPAPTKKPRKKPLTKDQRDSFFKKVASRANYLNKDVVEEVYNEMLRVIVNELRTKGQFELPDLACIQLSYHKPHTIKTPFYKNGITEPNWQISGYTQINWRTNYKLKAYFKEKPVEEKVLKKRQANGRLWYI